MQVVLAELHLLDEVGQVDGHNLLLVLLEQLLQLLLFVGALVVGGLGGVLLQLGAELDEFLLAVQVALPVVVLEEDVEHVSKPEGAHAEFESLVLPLLEQPLQLVVRPQLYQLLQRQNATAEARLLGCQLISLLC